MDITTFMNDVDVNKYIIQHILNQCSINDLIVLRQINKTYHDFIDKNYKIPLYKNMYNFKFNTIEMRAIFKYLIYKSHENHRINTVKAYDMYYEHILFHHMIINNINDFQSYINTVYDKTNEFINTIYEKKFLDDPLKSNDAYKTIMIMKYWLENFYPKYISKNDSK